MQSGIITLIGLLMVGLGAFPLPTRATVIPFIGRVIDTSPGSPVATRIVPTRLADGSVGYTVVSTVTGKSLATFTTAAAAITFTNQLNPTVPYR